MAKNAALQTSQDAKGCFQSNAGGKMEKSEVIFAVFDFAHSRLVWKLWNEVELNMGMGGDKIPELRACRLSTALTAARPMLSPSSHT